MWCRGELQAAGHFKSDQEVPGGSHCRGHRSQLVEALGSQWGPLEDLDRTVNDQISIVAETNRLEEAILGAERPGRVSCRNGGDP